MPRNFRSIRELRVSTVHASSEAVHLGFIVGLKHSRSIFLVSALLALSACDIDLDLWQSDEEAAEEAVEEAVNPVREALASGVSVAEAERALDRKDYQRAYDILREILVVDPTDDAAKLALARTYLARSEGHNAQIILDSLSEEARDSPRAHMLRGLALLVVGKLDEATAQLELALAEDPSLWRAANGLGLVNDIEQRWDQAEANYNLAVAIKSDSATVHNNMGYSYLLQGRVEDASKAFTTSLVYDPDLDIARSNLRLALAAEGRYADAIAGTERKDLPQVLNNIGFVAMSRGDYESADTFFHRAIDESPVYYDAAVQNLERLQTLVNKPADQSPVTRIGGSIGN